jgi:hypothetical protein
MEISEPVGAMDPESTTTGALASFPPVPAPGGPSLSFLLRLPRGLGLGLALLLAASVAAMKLGLLGSTRLCVPPCPAGTCSGRRPVEAPPSASFPLFPLLLLAATWEAECVEGARVVAAVGCWPPVPTCVAAVRAPLSLFAGGGAGFFF